MLNIGIITEEISMDLEEALKFVRKINIDYVEIHALWDKNIEELDNDEIEKVSNLLNKYDLKVSNIGSTLFLQCSVNKIDKKYDKIADSFLTVGYDYDGHIKALKRCIAIADKLNTDKIRIFGFRKDEDTSYDEGRKIATENLVEPIKIAERSGVKLIIENCPLTYFPTGSAVKKLIENLNTQNLGSLWDPANAINKNFISLIEEAVIPYPNDYESIKEYISHVHIKDSKYKSNDFTFVPVGNGDIDYKSIIKDLVKNNYKDILSLEPEVGETSEERIVGTEKSFNGLMKILNSL